MPSEPKVLAFDTSAAHCAAAFVGAGVVDAFEEMERGQAERLLPMLEETLAEAGCGWSDLTALGVGVGPGSFNGLRIGVATARGLGLALGIPVIGVTMFEVLHAGYAQSGRVLLSLPGPRGQAYVQPFINGIAQCAPSLLIPGDAPEGLGQPNLVVVGWAAEDIARPFDAPFRTREFDGPPDPALMPSRRMIARTIANIAAARVTGELPWDHARPAPLYIRPADAAPSRREAPKIIG